MKNELCSLDIPLELPLSAVVSLSLSSLLKQNSCGNESGTS
jgi:hypothetical protein